MCGSHAVSRAANESDRPNILLIVVDDQSPFDLQVYNPDSALQTPVISRLAREGMTLDGAHHMGSWSGAVCRPSRYMIMSGRTVWHLPRPARKRNRKSDPVDAAFNAPENLHNFTLPAVFNEAGYDTMRTCKNGNSYEAANAEFTVRKDATKRGGTPETGSAWHADRVLEYLDEREAGEDADPFLIYFGFSHPHDPRHGTPELLNKYGCVNHDDRDRWPPQNDRAPALPRNYLPAHPFHHGQPNLRDEVAVSGVWTRRDERTIRNEIGRQFACSENIDIQIGRVLSKLEAMGQLDNTYVFYTSDHGMAIGRHGLQGKQNLYEHTWRVPLIVRGPGIQASTRAQGNVYLLDLLATLCDFAGIVVPETNEGMSFKTVLEGKTQSTRDVLYGAYAGGSKPGIRCVKRGPWKLIQYDTLNGAVREKQLFNLDENPQELLKQHYVDTVMALTGVQPLPHQRNLAEDPRYADRLDEMEALMLAEQQRLDDPYPLWNQSSQQ
ncbi:MAG: sulfatase-like hydrolase/transferase [Planctomycetaceae bacterium]